MEKGTVARPQNSHPTVENRPDDFHMSEFRSLVFPDHLHTQIEVILPMEGELAARVDGEDCELGAGDALFVFPNRVHGYPRENDCRGLMLIFSPALLPDMEVDWDAMRPRDCALKGIDGDARYAAGRLWEKLADQRGQPGRETMALVHLLVSGLLGCAQMVRDDRPLVGDILYRAMTYVAENYQKEISLKKAAKAAGANEYYLSHLLNRRLHMDFRKYVNLLRLDKAKQYLQQKNMPVEEVAYQCGFSSLRSFDRVFAQFCGCSPREYRKGESGGK